MHDRKQCKHAADIILKIIGVECQGFILPPGEVRDLLGIRNDDTKWYLHKKVERLRKELAESSILLDVHPKDGITVMHTRPSHESNTLCSPRNIR
ncbi:MAG: hypothetical protein ACP5G0_03335 [Desulfomonilia bacterium]